MNPTRASAPAGPLLQEPERRREHDEGEDYQEASRELAQVHQEPLLDAAYSLKAATDSLGWACPAVQRGRDELDRDAEVQATAPSLSVAAEVSVPSDTGEKKESVRGGRCIAWSAFLDCSCLKRGHVELSRARTSADTPRDRSSVDDPWVQSFEGPNVAGTSRRVEQKTGDPIVALDAVPGVPTIGILRLDPQSSVALPGMHSHEFLALAYFERDGGTLRSRGAQWLMREGDVLVTGPGEPYDARGLAAATGWIVFFAPETVGTRERPAVLAWASHPLLFPFAARADVAPRRLSVREDGRPWWSARLAELDAELDLRRDGYDDASRAGLTLLLVATARLAAADVSGGFRGNDEPLLAEVFEVIERQYSGSASLRSIAAAVALTPGHLTTVVRRKTGRTVQGWILERRMVEARRLLVETDLSVEEVADRVGLADPRYFIRIFGKAHGTTRSAGAALPGTHDSRGDAAMTCVSCPNYAGWTPGPGASTTRASALISGARHHVCHDRPPCGARCCA